MLNETNTEVTSFDVPVIIPLKELVPDPQPEIFVVNLWGLKEFIHSQIKPGLTAADSKTGVLHEDYAFGCTLFCAFDQTGKARLGHFPLFSEDAYFLSQFVTWGTEVREQFDVPSLRYVVTGTNVTEEVREKVEREIVTVLQTPAEDLIKVYAEPRIDKNREAGLMSMLFWFPAEVLKSNKNTILIVQERNYSFSKPIPAERRWYQTCFSDELRSLLS